jgi:hypothetical protein
LHFVFIINNIQTTLELFLRENEGRDLYEYSEYEDKTRLEGVGQLGF